MNVELIIQSVLNNRAYELSQLVSTITWTTDILDQPSKLEFDMLPDNDVTLTEGDVVRFKFDGRGMFFGRVFKKKKNKNTWEVTALGNERYLANEDTMVFTASRSDERFSNICRLSGIPFRIRDQSIYRLQPAIHDGKSFYSMMEDAFTHTLINSGMWYIISDNFGTLEHIALNRMITNFVIGDQSLLTDFDYESSIENSFNVVKLVKDNEETNRRDVYMVRDSNLENRWGTLQYFQTINDELNPAQIREMANNMARSLRRPQRTLKVDSIGVKELKAGNSIVLQLADLAHEGYDKPTLSIIEKCTHTFDKQHNMSLELRVV